MQAGAPPGMTRIYGQVHVAEPLTQFPVCVTPELIAQKGSSAKGMTHIMGMNHQLDSEAACRSGADGHRRKVLSWNAWRTARGLDPSAFPPPWTSRNTRKVACTLPVPAGGSRELGFPACSCSYPPLPHLGAHHHRPAVPAHGRLPLTGLALLLRIECVHPVINLVGG